MISLALFASGVLSTLVLVGLDGNIMDNTRLYWRRFCFLNGISRALPIADSELLVVCMEPIN